MLEQVRWVVAGTQVMAFRRPDDDEGRYGGIEQLLQRFGDRQLRRADKGAVPAYLQRLSGYSRAPVTRLVVRWVAVNPLPKKDPLPHAPSTLLRAATRPLTCRC